MSGGADRGRKRAGLWGALAGPGHAGRAPAAARRAVLLSAVMVTAAVGLVPGTGRAGASPAQAPRTAVARVRNAPAAAGSFVTLLFSRTEISAADDCVEDDAGIARLDSTVAPYMHSLGIAGTGTLVTGRTYAMTRNCVHYDDDLTASWADAASLAGNYGWKFVSHTATYPTLKQIENFTPAQAYAQTCGTIATITSHGLPGAAGMIAYPGSYSGAPAARNLQQQYGQTCFDWGRKPYRPVHGVTGANAASRPPYWAYVTAVGGGACNDPDASCYSLSVRSNARYSLPSRIIARIKALQPGQWLMMEAYLLVTGTNPKYAHDRMRWNCTSSDPADHWTNVAVRYCWSDYQQILQAIAADPSITVADPLTVGTAWGRSVSQGSQGLP